MKEQNALPRRKKANPTALFISKKLQNRLDALASARTAFVVAPSGYGKTTAVNEFLAKDTRPALRLTLLESETPASGWQRFCALLEQPDPVAAGALRLAGAPDAGNIGEISQIFAQVECQAPTTLTIDNLQIWAEAFPRDLLTVFTRHSDNLRVILISQPLACDPFAARGDVLRIDQHHLAFSSEDISGYFAKAGAPIEAAEAETLFESTEGWAAALYLHLLNYLDTGSLACAAGDILSLMRQCLWNRVSPQARNALLRIGVFPCFSIAQLAFMLGEDDLPPALTHLLGSAGFVRYDSAQRVYFPHAILLKLLHEQFDALPPAQRARIWVRAGEWHEQVGNRLAAGSCYYQAGDFDRLLSIVPTDFEVLGAQRYLSLGQLRRMLDACPTEVKRRHPMTLIVIAYEFFSAGEYEYYGALCAEAAALIPQTDLPDEEKNRLWGELAVMESFAVYNDIRAMSRCHQRAYALIGGRSRIVDISVPWMMGCPSVLYMFHRESGRLDEEAAALEECLPLYRRLAGNHGRGAEQLMRAEVFFYRGDWHHAETRALEAVYLAEESGQTSVALAARFLLIRAALIRGDRRLLDDMLEKIEGVERSGAFPLRRQSELAFSYLWNLNDRPNEVAEWILDPDAQSVPAPAAPYAQMVYMQHCFGLRRHQEVHALRDVFLARAEAANTLLPRIYIHIMHACASYRAGYLSSAQESMSAALSLAVPDGLLVPFAEYAQDSLPLLEMIRIDGRMGLLASIRGLAADIAGGRARLHQAFHSQARPFALTTREYEIALLAARRHSNTEIAEATSLAVATVRTHLQAVYDKLGIDSSLKSKRNLLAAKLSVR